MKILGVHPGPLMYTKIFLRLEPLGLELVAAAARAAGHEVRLIDLQVEISRRSPAPDRHLAAGCHRLLVQLPGEHSGDHRPREGGEGAPAGHLRLRRRAQRIVRRAGDPRTWRKAPSTACCAARARPGFRYCSPRSRAGGDLTDIPGAVTADGRGPAARLCPFARHAAAGARPVAPPEKVFHRRARPVRVDRVLARLSVGLFVLQRLDVLRPQLSARQPGAGRRGSARDPRAGRLHRR